MSIKALNKVLQSILNGIKVETSGIWSYIKLPNGIAIAWGTYTERKTHYIHVSPLYGYSTSKIMFPLIFTERPKAFVSMSIGAGLGFYSSFLPATDGMACYGASTTSDAAGVLITCDILVIGRWK
ncbi:hypothetical protein NE619_13075 [Anaerovorax odorimutans]|uniref:Uncharacterized protein n=1 Tax=Anaerovorax odorimutans TaxID=109327 RepID=A0ABT1RR81_9FIRM|nr:hypothetical protein [Anaerovorax odorimutans]MCQ4637659.1 hypothetical protein [Anaerovorax odorimutans]